MNGKIYFEQGKYGRRCVVASHWDDSFLPKILDQEVKELELNDGKGWRGTIDFIEHLPNLESVTIIDLSIDNVKRIHSLSKLRQLKVITYCKTPIDFSAFPFLEDCALEWRTGSTSLFHSKSLKKLFIDNYKSTNTNTFRELINLRDLALNNASVHNIDGITQLISLNRLRLVNLNQLTTIEGIEALQNLKDLELHRCKKFNVVTKIFEIQKLKKLFLIDLGNIDSIKGIENLTELEEFLFYESTNVLDGDLTGLLKLKKLLKVSFKDRKHYSNKRTEFPN